MGMETEALESAGPLAEMADGEGMDEQAVLVDEMCVSESITFNFFTKRSFLKMDWD